VKTKDSENRARVVLASLAALGLVSWIDWVTGYEFLFFVFYFVPVAICAWHLSRSETLANSILCAVGWLLVDRLSEHHYTHEFIWYWNGFVCFLAFATVGLIVNGLRRSLLELARALEDVKSSHDEVRKLQCELQVVCAWTKRIKVDGQWIPLDEFMARKLHVQITHGISPEGVQQINESLDANGTDPVFDSRTQVDSPSRP